MKKLFFILFMFSIAIANAQHFSCNGTYIVTEPKEGLLIKDCCVCVNENYAELFLFDTDVVIPITSMKHMNVNDVCGNVYYLDKDKTSYVFYGENDNSHLCIVSILTSDGRWTFARTLHDK